MSTDTNTKDQALAELGISEDEAGQLLAAQREQEPTNDPGEGQDTGDAPAGSEAARWRRKLRDVESERDQLAERLTALQRGEVERLAGEHMSTPSDLWVLGTDLPSLLAEDGTVSHEKVGAAVQGILAERPTWGKHHRAPVPGKPRERLRGGGDPGDDHRTETSWSGILGGRK